MNAYKRSVELKRQRKAVKEQFSKTTRSLKDELPKQVVAIDKNTVVFAPEAASTLNIRSRYE